MGLFSIFKKKKEYIESKKPKQDVEFIRAEFVRELEALLAPEEFAQVMFDLGDKYIEQLQSDELVWEEARKIFTKKDFKDSFEREVFDQYMILIEKN